MEKSSRKSNQKHACRGGQTGQEENKYWPLQFGIIFKPFTSEFDPSSLKYFFQNSLWNLCE